MRRWCQNWGSAGRLPAGCPAPASQAGINHCRRPHRGEARENAGRLDRATSNDYPDDQPLAARRSAGSAVPGSVLGMPGGMPGASRTPSSGGARLAPNRQAPGLRQATRLAAERRRADDAIRCHPAARAHSHSHCGNRRRTLVRRQSVRLSSPGMLGSSSSLSVWSWVSVELVTTLVHPAVVPRLDGRPYPCVGALCIQTLGSSGWR